MIICNHLLKACYKFFISANSFSNHGNPLVIVLTISELKISDTKRICERLRIAYLEVIVIYESRFLKIIP